MEKAVSASGIISDSSDSLPVEAASATVQVEAAPASLIVQVEAAPAIETESVSDSLNENGRLDKGHKLQCELCDYASNHERGLNIHMSRKHTMIEQLDGVIDKDETGSEFEESDNHSALFPNNDKEEEAIGAVQPAKQSTSTFDKFVPNKKMKKKIRYWDKDWREEIAGRTEDPDEDPSMDYDQAEYFLYELLKADMDKSDPTGELFETWLDNQQTTHLDAARKLLSPLQTSEIFVHWENELRKQDAIWQKMFEQNPQIDIFSICSKYFHEVKRHFYDDKLCQQWFENQKSLSIHNAFPKDEIKFRRPPRL